MLPFCLPQVASYATELNEKISFEEDTTVDEFLIRTFELLIDRS